MKPEMMKSLAREKAPQFWWTRPGFRKGLRHIVLLLGAILAMSLFDTAAHASVYNCIPRGENVYECQQDDGGFTIVYMSNAVFRTTTVGQLSIPSASLPSIGLHPGLSSNPLPTPSPPSPPPLPTSLPLLPLPGPGEMINPHPTPTIGPIQCCPRDCNARVEEEVSKCKKDVEAVTPMFTCLLVSKESGSGGDHQPGMGKQYGGDLDADHTCESRSRDLDNCNKKRKELWQLYDCDKCKLEYCSY